MKLKAEVNGETVDVEVRREGSKVWASVDGLEYELDVTEPEDGVYSMIDHGRVHEASVQPAAGGGYAVTMDGAVTDIKIFDPRKLRGAGADAAAADGLAEIKTAMPGKVVRVLVNEGDAVEKGEGVVVVEAMKMQNELKSPKAGTVKSINAGEGSIVAAGDVLAVID
ncbi:MAG: acetyl-CoA carboxylase biotin carboxyl carrier protein subunit [Blastocatellia bacterium]|nr:acetyl-CoA carboxylase biotin carboxyl carrier protein subunit [Blastocatellia bacterium]